ncbi:hypothetical protein PVL29_023303 [Vitis rotundifolia]|uniref:YbaK/aminoacyl-tRNA synthetase-associated domain-containing protein n=2 Tax=Vitis rotundifolia TaxID=103349 RepID=A0AA38YNI9_VITRO|nr:hypothetical protein PVL29_023303 [Vitis rotundifolia]
MGHSKDQLLARLQELQIDFTKYEHPAVLTVEAQEKYVGHLGGGLSKNLFLKDKKHRFYIVSALKDTKVDLKVLSQRLGLGKGGLRMAPEEALGEILQVSLGCVTPFALVNESARHVSLFLDQGFKTEDFCFFHPLSNDMSIAIKACDLDKFLKSIGKEPSYVDLEANPTVGKDQPPDLAGLVPSDAIVLQDPPEKSVSSGPTEKHASGDNKSSVAAAKTVKPSNNAQKVKEKPASSVHQLSSFTDPGHFVEEILDKTSAIVLSEITEDAIKQHGEHLGAVLSDSIRKRLSLDLKNLAIIYKNTAYTEGFHAATHRQRKHI